MTGWEAFALVMIAIVGAGGPIVTWIGAREVRRNRQATEAVAESVGERNGHGTIQSQGVQMLAELRALNVSHRAVVDSVSSVTARLDGHDREIKDSKDDIGDHEDRLSALEIWRQAQQDHPGKPPRP